MSSELEIKVNEKAALKYIIKHSNRFSHAAGMRCEVFTFFQQTVIAPVCLFTKLQSYCVFHLVSVLNQSTKHFSVKRKKKKNKFFSVHCQSDFWAQQKEDTSMSPWACFLLSGTEKESNVVQQWCHIAVHHPNVTHTLTENLIIATTDQYTAPDIDLHISETSV